MKTKLINIETLIIDLPTIRPHKLSMATMQKQTMVIIRVKTDDGIVGIGEATTIGGLTYGEESPEGMKLAIDTYFYPVLKELDVTNVNLCMHKLGKMIKGNRIAKSGIETALLDAQAKRLDITLATLLGGSTTNTLPVLWTLASGDTQKDIDEAHQLLEQKRHNVFKLKIGSNDPEVDIKHVASIKKSLGDKAKVTVDINQAWSESTANWGLAKLQDAGVDLFEQPIAKENHAGLIRLSQKFNHPVMADEAVSIMSDAHSLVSGGFTGVFALKIGKSGGPVSVLKVANVAQSAGIALYGGTLLEGTIGTVASAIAFSTLGNMEWGTELFGPLLLTDDIVTNPMTYKDFHLELPTGKGLGLELDEDKIKHYKRR